MQKKDSSLDAILKCPTFPEQYGCWSFEMDSISLTTQEHERSGNESSRCSVPKALDIICKILRSMTRAEHKCDICVKTCLLSIFSEYFCKNT